MKDEFKYKIFVSFIAHPSSFIPFLAAYSKPNENRRDNQPEQAFYKEKQKPGDTEAFEQFCER
jgi:hypothetical protein